MPDGKPDLSGRWGGGGGGTGEVTVRLPDGKQQKFESLEAYDEAIAKEQLDPKAILIGRQTGYRHGNNDYSGKDAVLNNRYKANPPVVQAGTLGEG